MPMTPKQMVKFLKKNGFHFVSQTGSHAKYRNDHTNRVTLVPMHNKDLKKGMERTILKQAGLLEKE